MKKSERRAGEGTRPGDEGRAEGGEGMDVGGDGVTMGKVADMLDTRGEGGEGEGEDEGEGRGGSNQEAVEEAEGNRCLTLRMRGEGEGEGSAALAVPLSITRMGDSVKRVLLTSAGDDISKGIAFRLAKAGCRLVLMGDKNQLQKMVGDMASSLKEVNAFKIVGLNMEEDLEAVFDEAVDLAWKLLGTLDAFVNCCAYEDPLLSDILNILLNKVDESHPPRSCLTLPSLFLTFEIRKMQACLDVTEHEYKKTIKINFMAPWFLLKAVAKRMRDNKTGGSIVFISQILGTERGLYPGAAAYGSSLAGVQQLVRVIAFSSIMSSFQKCI
ncbi:short chain dehydrogenase [Musa troglodytarum]|uniref:Short chain dehydrogenase n=1 Tax=Musa troglodytarum TaxID=320322 RepID=A0A9E7L791_9LILI|nr:short chain dehydrogenase [Musa troglodytarum]